jgi:hypothetical protein
MLYNTKALSLHCVFHSIRFKVIKKGWSSEINPFLFIGESVTNGISVNFHIVNLIRESRKNVLREQKKLIYCDGHIEKSLYL